MVDDPKLFKGVIIKLIKNNDEFEFEVVKDSGRLKKGERHQLTIIKSLRKNPLLQNGKIVIADLKLIKRYALHKVEKYKDSDLNISQKKNVESKEIRMPKCTIVKRRGGEDVFDGNQPKLEELLIPSDTKKTLEKGKITVSNYLLSLTKYARFREKGKKSGFILFEKENGKIKNLPNKSAFKHAEYYSRRQNRILSTLKPAKFTAEVSGRMVVGLGVDNVHEISITLHHIGGFPYIPASAIKGVVRSYIIDKFFAGNEDNAFNDRGFKLIFGFSDESSFSGLVKFYDSYPINSPIIQPDIMNVHYSKYYQSMKEPTDNQLPVPISFLTVTEAKFQFNLTADRTELFPSFETKILDENGKSDWEHSSVLDVISFHLKKALELFGVGAKTAIGYGRLTAS